MAKKKKNSNDDFNEMLMSALDDMLNSLSPDMKDKIVDKMNEYAAEGKDMIDMQNETYLYQRPDYTKDAKPLAECLLPLQNAAKPSEALEAYAKIHDEMKELSKDEQEQILRNYLMNVLADGLTHDFENENEKSCLPLFVVFQLVDDFQLIGLFDVILETLKQAPNFFHFYYGSFEDVATLILARVGMDHLDELKEMIKTDGFVSEVYPTVFNAVVQMAIENPFCRLQVLAWTSDVLKSCIETTIPSMAMDWIVKSLAQIKAVDLLPLIKEIYKEYKVPAVEIKNGIKGVTKLLSKGTDERIVDFLTFKEMLERLKEGEDCGFDLFGDHGYFDDEEDDEDEDEWEGAGWLEDMWNGNAMMDDHKRNTLEADALLHKELNKSHKKKGQRYLYTLDVTLKGSPRKVYRQLTVPSDMSLGHLGEVLVAAVGWEGYHLNQFIKDRNTCYLLPDEDGNVDYGYDARQYTIGDLLKRVGTKIQWEYDFGDSWTHELKLVEKVAIDKEDEAKVTLVKATGACPPEDCGGVGGYRYLLNALKNPGSEEYEEMVGWLGGGFDPKAFNLSAARQRIAGYMKGIKNKK